MIDATKPDTFPFIISLAAAGWTVDKGEFGFNGNPKQYSEDYRTSNITPDGSTVECRQLRLTHPTVKKFFCILSQVGDDIVFSVEAIAPKAKALGLDRKYFYPGHVNGDAMDAVGFKKFLMESYERVYVRSVRDQLQRVEGFLASL